MQVFERVLLAYVTFCGNPGLFRPLNPHKRFSKVELFFFDLWRRDEPERRCYSRRVRAKSDLDAPEIESMDEIFGEWRIPQGFQEPESQVLFRASPLTRIDPFVLRKTAPSDAHWSPIGECGTGVQKGGGALFFY